MALKGNLRDFSVTQLLNLINLARKTGTLTIEGPTEAAWVSFRDGKLIYAQLGNEDGTLVGILLRGGLVSARQARAIKTHASDKNDKELGLLLINAGYLVQQSILASIRQYFLDIVYKLFNWGEGFFRFDAGVLPPEGRITIRLNLENIIIEGSRRMREWEKLKDEVPNLEMALDFVERPGANIRDVNLNVEEWKVVSYVNPKNTIAQIAKANQMNDLEIRRVVYGLLHAGLVEVVRPDGMPIPARVKQFKPIDEGQRVSLVNRLIQRIRSL
ncbi:MAG: DUF4388 domain-containing protein [Anaerolineales bacterium]|nr:DUF4388 domain-containing protein [Anaerolineales bacterium]